MSKHRIWVGGSRGFEGQQVSLSYRVSMVRIRFFEKFYLLISESEEGREGKRKGEGERGERERDVN